MMFSPEPISSGSSEDLRRDLQDNRAQWENLDLDSFLEAMAAYIEGAAMSSEEPTWDLLATLLWAGSRYE